MITPAWTERGALVLVLDEVPDAVKRMATISNEERGEMATVERKAADARAHGAVGLIIGAEATSATRTRCGQCQPRSAPTSYRLLAPMRDAPMPVSPSSPNGVPRRCERRSMRTRSCARYLNPDVIVTPSSCTNILGVVEGRQPAAEMVVVGAHMDHDGIDEAGRIYNGADDNASGTAAVLAMAAAFTRAAARGSIPSRAVVFALWNGEEKGELGAEYYAAPGSGAPRRRQHEPGHDWARGRNSRSRRSALPGFAKDHRRQNTNVVHLLGYILSPDLAASSGARTRPSA